MWRKIHGENIGSGSGTSGAPASLGLASEEALCLANMFSKKPPPAAATAGEAMVAKAVAGVASDSTTRRKSVMGKPKFIDMTR